MIIEQLRRYLDSCGIPYEADLTSIDIEANNLTEEHYRRILIISKHHLMRRLLGRRDGDSRVFYKIWLMGQRPEWDWEFRQLDKVGLAYNLKKSMELS